MTRLQGSAKYATLLSGGLDSSLLTSIIAKHTPADIFAMTIQYDNSENNIDFAVDVYPYYGSDADVALVAGYDVKHGLIGAGVYASHGYERSHKDGVMNTFALLTQYIK